MSKFYFIKVDKYDNQLKQNKHFMEASSTNKSIKYLLLLIIIETEHCSKSIKNWATYYKLKNSTTFYCIKQFPLMN